MKLKPKIEEPKDLGVKIGTKEEVAWTNIRENAIKELEENQRAILIGKKIIDLAEEKISEEKEKLK